MLKRFRPEEEEVMMKRHKGLDHLSNLHDSILTHILSFLPTKDILKTSLLSKRWLDTWTSVPALDFFVTNPSDVDFIEEVLSLRNASADISRFHLVLPNSSWKVPTLTCQIDSWVDYAVKHNAVDVKIILQHQENTEVIFLDLLLNHRQLQSLELDLIIADSIFYEPIVLPSRSCLNHLRVLNLKICGKISGESLWDLLSNCPALEELSLDSWFDELSISSWSLKKLHLTVQDSTEIKISCPNLELFKLDYNCSYREGFGSFQGHLPSVVKANVELHRSFGGGDDDDDDDVFVNQLSNSFSDTAKVNIQYKEGSAVARKVTS